MAPQGRAGAATTHGRGLYRSPTASPICQHVVLQVQEAFTGCFGCLGGFLPPSPGGECGGWTYRGKHSSWEPSVLPTRCLLHPHRQENPSQAAKQGSVGEENAVGAPHEWDRVLPATLLPSPQAISFPLCREAATCRADEGLPVPYRRRGLQFKLPTVTLGTPRPWEKKRKESSSPSSWDLCVERKTSGTSGCGDGGGDEDWVLRGRCAAAACREQAAGLLTVVAALSTISSCPRWSCTLRKRRLRSRSRTQLHNLRDGAAQQGSEQPPGAVAARKAPRDLGQATRQHPGTIRGRGRFPQLPHPPLRHSPDPPLPQFPQPGTNGAVRDGSLHGLDS